MNRLLELHHTREEIRHQIFRRVTKLGIVHVDCELNYRIKYNKRYWVAKIDIYEENERTYECILDDKLYTTTKEMIDFVITSLEKENSSWFI